MTSPIECSARCSSSFSGMPLTRLKVKFYAIPKVCAIKTIGYITPSSLFIGEVFFDVL